MTIEIGNAPCSWGVEFADDPRNPPWRQVLRECREAGYRGIELGPVGYLPEDPAELSDGLAENDLTLIGGVVFRPFHDAAAWDDVLDGSVRTCRALKAHGAEHLVLIDSISPRRAPTAGRADEAEAMASDEWRAYIERISIIAKMGTEDYGLTVSLHPHAAGFMDFESEIVRALEEVDEAYLKICLDTGHSTYAGFDPLTFMEAHIDRVSYVHFKSTDASVKQRVIANRTGFYEACGQGIFCRLAEGEIDFGAVRTLLQRHDYRGWCTVEQDCDPAGNTSPVDDAADNRRYLASIGFA